MSHVHTPAHASPAGEIVLDRYRLVRRIGAGGMGVVFLATDERLEREVAVKRIAIELDPDGRGEREALAAARLSHPGIVSLYESGRDEHAVYLVAELVRGRTLAALIAAGDLSDRDVVLIGMTLCDALEHAHARGVVHRDVKPSNVICPETPGSGSHTRSPGGSQGTGGTGGTGVVAAKLTDFGIALMAGGDALTRTGDIIGTLAYMAPEQARGAAVTGAADVYALGVVLYEGLSGVNPVRAGNPAATALRVGQPLPALQRVRRDLPTGLCRAIDAAVVPDPQRRAGLSALRLALSHAVDRVADEIGPVATGPSVTRTTRMLTGRSRREDPVAPTRVLSQPDMEDGGERWPLRDGGREPPPLLLPRDDAESRRELRRRRRAERAPGPDRRDPPAPWPAPAASGHRAAPTELTPPAPRAPLRRRLVLRLPAAAGAAALAGGALAWLGAAPPVSPGAGGLVAGLAVLVLPRLGWLAMVAVLMAWLVATLPGVALLAAIAAAPVPVLLPKRGVAWSLPAIAPLLGVVGLAGAWPALAGQARSWTARAALGALGGLWLVLAEALTSARLLTGQPRDVLGAGAWDGSVFDAVREAVVPLLSGGTLAIAALWAVAAAVLPALVRGRSAALDLVAAAGWAAGLAAATQALAQSLSLEAPRGLVVGALAAGALAVGARAAQGRA